VIGLRWGWWNLPLTKLRVSAPPLPKLLLAIKNPVGSCNDPKGKQNGGSRCSLEFQCYYNARQNANRREENTLVSNDLVLSTILLLLFFSFVLSLCFLMSYNILSLLNTFYEFSNMLDGHASTSF
jgi:hypothetical protein